MHTGRQVQLLDKGKKRLVETGRGKELIVIQKWGLAMCRALQESPGLGRRTLAFYKETDIILEWMIDFVLILELMEKYLKASSSWKMQQLCAIVWFWFYFLEENFSFHVSNENL